MSHHATIRRYTLEVEKIMEGQMPSFIKIQEYLEQYDFIISKRTLQRDIEQIRFEFGVEIKYNRSKNGYYIDENESVDMESFVKFLEIVSTANLIQESLKESKDSLKHISFGSHGTLKGIENLKPILKAIQQHREIKVKHENFQTGKVSTYPIKPYLLREYQNRWYVIGIIGNMKDFRSTAVDRIIELTETTTVFKPKSDDVKDLFKHVVGVVYSLDTLQKIKLWFSPLQAKYAKSLPIHPSQKIISDDDKTGMLVELTIIPNFEFIQKILMYGENVKVIEPTGLVDKVKAALTSALKNYK